VEWFLLVAEDGNFLLTLVVLDDLAEPFDLEFFHYDKLEATVNGLHDEACESWLGLVLYPLYFARWDHTVDVEEWQES
jgi:hypothetical protein